MQLLFIVLSLIQLHSIDAGGRNLKRRPARPPKPINWNSSYYSQPFRPCNPLREYNPVEFARAHGLAVDVFRKCAPSLIIPFATKYHFPAYGLYRVGEIFCILLNIGTAYFDLYGQTNVEDYDPADDALALMRTFCEAMGKGNKTILVKHGREKYFISHHMCHEFVYKAMECGLKKCGVRNGEYAKHLIEHALKMLL